MILGRVTGHLWATRKSARLSSRKLVIVTPLYAYRLGTDHIVATDDVGAELGQTVVVCIGSPPRWSTGDTRTPTDAAVAAIVDHFEVTP